MHAGPELARYRALPAFVVGDATARAAASAGLTVRHVGQGDGAALAQAAAAAGVRRMLHLCGREHRPLRGSVQVTACPVYAADACRDLPVAAVDALRHGAVVLLHSPRAAALFAGLSDAAGLARGTILLAAISARAAPAPVPAGRRSPWRSCPPMRRCWRRRSPCAIRHRDEGH
ncbi:uroporphyrinogen-III synthase [Bradyrhizobium sp.]|uniref:uroporphyrinogen-III synthase n=1 Tax=Bradyrhizobium sp. TaxID=376 RepID=UPI00345DD676